MGDFTHPLSTGTTWDEGVPGASEHEGGAQRQPGVPLIGGASRTRAAAAAAAAAAAVHAAQITHGTRSVQLTRRPTR